MSLIERGPLDNDLPSLVCLLLLNWGQQWLGRNVLDVGCDQCPIQVALRQHVLPLWCCHYSLFRNPQTDKADQRLVAKRQQRFVSSGFQTLTLFGGSSQPSTSSSMIVGLADSSNVVGSGGGNAIGRLENGLLSNLGAWGASITGTLLVGR